MDRYYYPDLINKSSALSGRSPFDVTYSNEIEQYVLNTPPTNVEAAKYLFFDKISDLYFKENETYIYDRTNRRPLTINSIADNSGYQYYEDINKSGKITMCFNIVGDDSEWSIYSNRNDIDSGITIQKQNSQMRISIRLYDYDGFYYDSSDFFDLDFIEEYYPVSDIFLGVGIDTVKGEGYIILNDNIVKRFTIDKYEYTIKKILYGNFIYEENGENKELFQNTKIKNLIITDSLINPSDVLFIRTNNSKETNNNITITLPCGLRNSIDNIDIIQSLTPNHFKSNNLDVYIKNLGNLDDAVVQLIRQKILNEVSEYLPTNTTIKNLKFENYR
jgi:hypothetical protein